MSDLLQLRGEIDRIDREIVRLFEVGNNQFFVLI